MQSLKIQFQTVQKALSTRKENTFNSIIFRVLNWLYLVMLWFNIVDTFANIYLIYLTDNLVVINITQANKTILKKPETQN